MKSQAKKPLVNSEISVLILCDYYLPGYKAGGPIRSIYNLTSEIVRFFKIKIITRDRDLGDKKAYSKDKKERCCNSVIYMSSGLLSFIKMVEHIKNAKNSVIYLNSFFSLKYSILPVLANKLLFKSKRKIVLNPRGELLNEAIKIKPRKKYIYIYIANLLKFYEPIYWQVTDPAEKKQVQKIFKPGKKIYELTNITKHEPHQKRYILKENDTLKLVYISRITKKKNLIETIKIIRRLKGDIQFDIWGPIEDHRYWRQCLRLIEKTPKNIKIRYMGEVEHRMVPSIMLKYHFLILLSLSENFGHVIAEAINSGVPVIISDRTPWGRRGWQDFGIIVSLQEKEEIMKILQEIVSWGNRSYFKQKERIYGYLEKMDRVTKKLIKEYIYMIQEIYYEYNSGSYNKRQN
jgi:glycosyltransferase involved in cell wall biosynthesis